MKYKILSHTADLRLEIYGETMEELFENAAEALARILYGRNIAERPFSDKIKAQSINPNILLVDFLNEILARSYINKSVYKVKQIKIRPFINSGQPAELEVKLIGAKVDKFDEDIKAITYHEVNIKKENGILKTKLVLDI